MIILVSPTKQMKIDLQEEAQLPHFLSTSKKIMKQLKKQNQDDIKNLMKVNDKIAVQNKERFTSFRFDQKGTWALHAYCGLQYQQIKPELFNEKESEYANEHIRILSGLYGVLKPYDSIYSYRLEMQCRIGIENYNDLYHLWEKRISKHLIDTIKEQEEKKIINLSSKEYTKVLSKACREYVVDVTFKIEKKGVLKVEATQAKMARGKMVRFLVRNQIECAEEIKEFCEDGYQYDEALSNDNEYIFVKRSK